MSQKKMVLGKSRAEESFCDNIFIIYMYTGRTEEEYHHVM